MLGVGLLALATTACGDDDSQASAAGDSTAPSAAPAASAAPAGSTAPSPFDVATAEHEDLGTLLVDPAGHTLYFTEREADGTVHCQDDCVDFWPPLTVEAADVAGTAPVSTADADAGAALRLPPELADSAARFATVERPDGTMQVTFDGMPLYTFSTDEAPGDVRGNGLEDVFGDTGFIWHAAVFTETPSSVPASSTPAVVDDGYRY